MLLDLLHRALGVERVDEDLASIKTGLVRDRLARVLGGARELEGLRAAVQVSNEVENLKWGNEHLLERSVKADLAHFVLVL